MYIAWACFRNAFYYIAINILSDFRKFIALKTTFYGADFRFYILGDPFSRDVMGI